MQLVKSINFHLYSISHLVIMFENGMMSISNFGVSLLAFFAKKLDVKKWFILYNTVYFFFRHINTLSRYY